MNVLNEVIRRVLALLLVVALCGAPSVAQTIAPDPQDPDPAETQTEEQEQEEELPESEEPIEQPVEQPQTSDEPALDESGQPIAPEPPLPTPGATVDPAQGPLEPVPTEVPDAPSSVQQQEDVEVTPAQPATTTTQEQPKVPPAPPVGAAAAEKGRTVGGAASKPAGTAIAPAKQPQKWSWLIKLGAVAGAGVAIGTVWALSRSSPSTPPGSGR